MRGVGMMRGDPPVKIGTHRLRNVPASIGPLTSGLLLGKSALDQRGTWSIDSQRKRLILGAQVAHQATPAQQQPLSEAEMDELVRSLSAALWR